MNHSAPAWTPIDSKRLLVGFLLAVFAAAFGALLTASPAQAGGDSGTGPGGGGSCTIQYGWRYVTNWNAFNAAGQSCGTTVYNNGKSRAVMASVGAVACYDNRNQLDAIWYLTGDSSGTIWIQHADDDHRTASKSAAIRAINNSPASADAKEYGRAAVNRGSAPVLLVCTWPGQRGVTCNDLPQWDTKVRQRGAVGTRKYSSREAALNNCILSCPTLNTQANDGNYRRWVREGRSDDFVPLEAASGANLNGDAAARDAARGDWCFSRPRENNTETRTQREYRVGTEIVDNLETDYYPYSWRTDADGGALGSENPHPGPTKFEWQCRQPSAEDPSGTDVSQCGTFTPFGELLGDAISSGQVPEDPEVVSSVTDTARAGHVSFDLSEANATALAEGGILNITERTTLAALLTRTYSDVPQERTRTMTCQNPRTFEFTYSRSGSATMTGTSHGRTCTDWSDWGRWRDRGIADEDPLVELTLAAQTPQVTGFWQALANHCYADGFTDSLSGAETIANGDDSKTISGSAVTPKMNNADDPFWGPDSRYPATAQAGFFDKECGFNGVRVGEGEPSSVTHFRDNESRAIGVDFFVPADSAVVNYQDEPALTTTVTRWALGTPQPNGISDKGIFRMLSGDEEVFNSDEGVSGPSAPVQRNWDVSEFKSRNLSILGGEHRDFTVAANWPSDDGMPEVFTYKWEYDPDVANTIPTQNVGFAGPRGARTYVANEVWVPIQGKVYADFSSGTTPGVTSELSANTGSGSINDLDGVLYWGANLDGQNRWQSSPDTYQPYYQALRFVRATTE